MDMTLQDIEGIGYIHIDNALLNVNLFVQL